MLYSCENCIPNLAAVSSLYIFIWMWKSNFTREQESKARDSAPTQGFWHSTHNGLDKGDRKIHTYTNTNTHIYIYKYKYSTKNGLDKGDRKIHKYTNTNTHIYKYKYSTHTMDWTREMNKTNQTKNIYKSKMKESVKK